MDFNPRQLSFKEEGKIMIAYAVALRCTTLSQDVRP